MKRQVRLGPAVLAGLLAVLLSGCGKGEEEDMGPVGPYAQVVAMEGTPVVDYAVPQLLPNILVDLRGYSTEGEKIAAVRGRQLPEQFCLIDASTKEVVYNGVIEKTAYNEELSIYTGYADFSDLKKEGSYYIRCDIVGHSYDFVIENQLYGALFQEIYEQFLEACGNHGLTISEAVTILEAYEWYKDIFPDEDKNEIPDILEALTGWIAYVERNGINGEQSALYTAFLAKFSYLYQKFDHQYATDCLQRASTVFEQVQTSLGRDADSFFALTELYRATNLATYRKQILDYKSFFQNNSSYMEQTGYLYGGMTYLVTRHSVDVELCEIFIDNVMNRGEEISKRYEDMIHPVTARNNGSAELLKQAVELSCANYALKNSYQYTNIIEEILHYLMGRNRESVSFYETEQDRGSYLLLFAQLASNHET